MRFLEFIKLNEDKPIGEMKKELWLDYLKKKYSDKDVKNLFVSFVSEDKIGINPKSTFKTPNGVYTYPMKFLLDDNPVPFRGSYKPKKIKILKAVSEKVLDHSLSNKNYNIAVEKLVKNYRDRFDVNNIEKYLENFEEINSEENNYKKLWKLTFQIKKNSNDWTKMLIDLGFDWSNDNGEGVIHISEPTQAVFLNPSSYKLIDEEFVDTEERYKETNERSIGYYKLRELLKAEYYTIKTNQISLTSEIKKEYAKGETSKILELILFNVELSKLNRTIISDIYDLLNASIEKGLFKEPVKILEMISDRNFKLFLNKFSDKIEENIIQDLKLKFVPKCTTSTILKRLGFDELDFYGRYSDVIKFVIKSGDLNWLKFDYIKPDFRQQLIEYNKELIKNLLIKKSETVSKNVDLNLIKYLINSFSDKEQELLKTFYK